MKAIHTVGVKIDLARLTERQIAAYARVLEAGGATRNGYKWHAEGPQARWKNDQFLYVQGCAVSWGNSAARFARESHFDGTEAVAALFNK